MTIYNSIPAQYGRLVSVSAPCEGVTLRSFLRHAVGQSRFYWESSRDDLAFAGFGTALEVMAWGKDRFQTVHHHALELFAEALLMTHTPLANPRLFGGFAFLDDFVPDNTWADFTPAHFVLPHYQFVQTGGQSYLTINAHVPYGENPHESLEGLKEALNARIDWLKGTPEPPLPEELHPTETRYPMNFEAWDEIITRATVRMKQGELKKAVLSRVAEIRFMERVNVDNALDFLAKVYPQTYRFLFEPRPYHAFYGATPELLAQVDGKHVQTMGLAGSIRRGKTPQEDEMLAEQLLSDPKERFEHELVVANIRDRLMPLTESLTVGETGIYPLSNIQHLYTPISGRLKNNDGIVPIIEKLHPTPALGGEPREVALQVIGDSETVTRGWFGAPIGWIDTERQGQFGVAIRSAIAQEQRVWLYAGAGIVAESHPQKEWDETSLKFKPMLNALGISGGDYGKP